MILQTFLIGFVLTISQIEGMNKKFRYDYTFSSEADGWLKLHVVPATWSDAKLRCHAEGAVLASPLTDQLRKAIIALASQEPHSVDSVFTGVHATYSPGDYTSVEGVPLSRLAIIWNKGEPNNVQNSERCVALSMNTNGTAYDVSCSGTRPYFCYKKRTTLMKNSCGTNDPEYNLDYHTGNCYKFHRWGMTWAGAYMTCLAEGGYLAIINSFEEARVMQDLLNKNPASTTFAQYNNWVFMGFRNQQDGGSWMTIHGQTLIEAGFNEWKTNMPSFKPNTEDLCGTIWRDENQNMLNDVGCDLTASFICEKQPDSLENSDDTFGIY